MASHDKVSAVARWVPMVGWLPRYQRSMLRPDVIAGLTIWGLLVPEMIAYASLAGLPPQAGLYTLLATLGLYAIFGTSRQLVVAGTSASAVLVFSAVAGLASTSSSDTAALAAGMIIVTGVLLVVAGLLRLGFITQFLSRPVMAGFVFGIAIFVAVGQLPKLLGIEKGEGDTVQQLGHIIASIGSFSVTTLTVGLAALAVLYGLERYAPRIPGGLVVLVLGITLSALFDLSSHGVAIIGDIPTGLPSLAAPRHPTGRPLGPHPVCDRHDARDLQRSARSGDNFRGQARLSPGFEPRDDRAWASQHWLGIPGWSGWGWKSLPKRSQRERGGTDRNLSSGRVGTQSGNSPSPHTAVP